MTLSIMLIFLLVGTAAYCAQPDEIHRWENRKDLENLVKALGERDATVRESAALALGRIGDHLAVDPLVPLLGDEVPKVREAAAWALERLGEPLGELIPRGLKGDRDAMEKLAERKDPRAVVPLLNALEASDGNLRAAAAWGLRSIRDPDTVDPLIKALKDPEPVVRSSAAWALEKIGNPRSVDPLLAALRDYDPHVREAAAWALGNAGNRRAVGPLIDALGDRHPFVREAVAGALKKLDEPLGEVIFRALAGSEKTLEELARKKDRRAIDVLVKALDSLNVSVAVAAARALGEIGDPEAFEPLSKALVDVHEDIRRAAAEALGTVGDRRAVAVLVGALGDRYATVRIGAARSLGKIGDRRAVDPLIDVLDDSDAGVREAAATALEELGEPIGRQIQEALEGSPTALETFSKGKDARIISIMLQFLESGDGNLRRAAAKALGATDDPRAQEGLMKMAGGWNPGDRFRALMLLVNMRHREGGSVPVSFVLRILVRPASILYLVIILVPLGFGIYRIGRRGVTRRSAKENHR